MPGKWPRTHYLRSLAQQADSLANKRLSGKGWPRKRAAKQHLLLTIIKNTLHESQTEEIRDHYINEWAEKHEQKVAMASSIWSAYAIGRRSLAEMASHLLELANQIEPHPAPKVPIEKRTSPYELSDIPIFHDLPPRGRSN